MLIRRYYDQNHSLNPTQLQVYIMLHIIQLPEALSMSTSDEADDSDRSLPPTSERIKELISNTINRILSALSLSSGNLKLLVSF